MKIIGKLATTSPTLITSTRSLYVTADGRATYIKGPGAFPATSQVRMPVMFDGRPVEVPIIPANTLRGALRRQSAAIVVEHLRKTGEQISLPTYQCLLSGAVHGHPDSGPLRIDGLIEGTQHVVIGLFGGGPRFIPSSVRIDTAWPICQPLMDNRVIPHFGDNDAVRVFIRAASEEAVKTDYLHGLTGFYHLRRADDLTNAIPGGYDFIEGGIDRLADWFTLFHQRPGMKGEDEMEGGDAKKGIKSVAGLSFSEAIIAGVPFACAFDCTGATLEQQGLFLLSLMGFCHKQRLGANGRHGFGRFAYEFEVHDNDGAVIGSLTGGPAVHPSEDALTDALRERIAAARAAIANITGASLRALTAPSAAATADVRGKVKAADAVKAYDRLYTDSAP